MTDGSRTSRRAKSTTAKRSAATGGSGKSGAPSNQAARSKKRAEASLDEALDDTFPASDPVSPKHIT